MPEFTLNIWKMCLLWLSGHNYKTCQKSHHVGRYDTYNEYVGYASNVQILQAVRCDVWSEFSQFNVAISWGDWQDIVKKETRLLEITQGDRRKQKTSLRFRAGWKFLVSWQFQGEIFWLFGFLPRPFTQLHWILREQSWNVRSIYHKVRLAFELDLNIWWDKQWTHLPRSKQEI